MQSSDYTYTLVSTDTGEETLTVFLPDGPATITRDHPTFEETLSAVRAGDPAETIRDLVDLETGVANRLHPLSDRVSVADGHIYFDGDKVDNTVTRTILRFLEGGIGDWRPMVRFMENLAANPNRHSREQLYDWLQSVGDFALTEDGCFIGYKGVARNANGDYVSVSHGPAIVDGQPVNGAVPNTPGSVVELGRSQVTFDPSIGCASGLHVGTFTYAKQWARGGLLKVKVNPRDCVSVPTDSNYEKLRVCRYRVLDTIDAPETRPLVPDYSDTDPDDREDAYTSRGY